jgi:hypothetical protein
VEAEIYAADAPLLRVGQRATIQADGGPGQWTGEVICIGAQVRKPAVLINDPVAFNDAHVVPVLIRIFEWCSTESACPLDARVRVAIETRP